MKKMKIDDSHFVPIVRDGAIATGDTADGRNIPVLILDCRGRVDISNLISLHEESPPGDALITWGANKKYVFLMFEFERPAKVSFGVKFELVKQAGLA